MYPKYLFVFDIDGTLTNSVSIHHSAFRKMLLNIGIKNINQDFEKCKHHTDSYIVQSIYQEEYNEQMPSVKIKEFESGLYSIISRQVIEEIKGAKQFVDELKIKNIGVCYATGSLRRPAIHKLQSIGIDFDPRILVASDDLYKREEIVSQAIHHAESIYQVDQFDKILSIGDGLWDWETAKKLNLEFVGIGKNEELLRNKSSIHHFNNLVEMQNGLSTLLK